MKNNGIALSILCLGICFIIGSWLIAQPLEDKQKMESKQATQKQLFTQSELVAYLGISQKDVQLLTELPDSQGYTSELPHLKIGETFYYSKKSIDKWLVDMDTSVIHPPYE